MSLLSIIGFIAVNIYFISNIVFSVGNDVKMLNAYETLKLLFLISWLTIIVWLLITVLIFKLIKSGQPYKSELHESNEKYISRLFLLWALVFIIKAILSYFLLQNTFDL